MCLGRPGAKIVTLQGAGTPIGPARAARPGHRSPDCRPARGRRRSHPVPIPFCPRSQTSDPGWTPAGHRPIASRAAETGSDQPPTRRSARSRPRAGPSVPVGGSPDPRGRPGRPTGAARPGGGRAGLQGLSRDQPRCEEPPPSGDGAPPPDRGGSCHGRRASSSRSPSCRPTPARPMGNGPSIADGGG
jgi:hypothetical protein